MSYDPTGTPTVSTVGAVTATSLPTQLSVPGSTNTKGSWTELSASTPIAARAVIVHILSDISAGVTPDMLVDLGVGAAASEVVVIPNLLAGLAQAAYDARTYVIPVNIAAGVRLAARYQANTASTICRVHVSLLGAGAGGTVVALGANTGDSGGVSIDPGGSANTKGAWTEVIASTSARIDRLAMAFGNQSNNVRTDYSFLFDIATGGSGSETAILSNLFQVTRSTVDAPQIGCHGPVPVNIPAGTRLSVRSQCSGTDATDRLLDVVLYGITV